MKKIFTTSVILNILLLSVILIMRECKPRPEVIAPRVEIDTLTLYDTIKLPGAILWYPKPVYITKPSDTIFRTHEDTTGAVTDYQLTRSYCLPVVDDSNGKIDVYADLQYNKIKNWTYDATFYQKTLVVDKTTIVKEKPKSKLFVGFNTGYSIQDTSMMLAPAISFLTKKDHLYGVSYEPFKKVAEVQFMWKIKLRRK
jgi:hypothetical protein